MAKTKALSPQDKAALRRLNDFLEDVDISKGPLTPSDIKILQPLLDRLSRGKGRPPKLERDISVAIDAELLIRSGKYKSDNAAYTAVADKWTDLDVPRIREIHQHVAKDPLFPGFVGVASRKKIPPI